MKIPKTIYQGQFLRNHFMRLSAMFQQRCQMFSKLRPRPYKKYNHYSSVHYIFPLKHKLYDLQIIAAVCAFLLIVDGLITVNLGQLLPDNRESPFDSEDNDPVSHILDSLQY